MPRLRSSSRISGAPPVVRLRGSMPPAAAISWHNVSASASASSAPTARVIYTGILRLSASYVSRFSIGARKRLRTMLRCSNVRLLPPSLTMSALRSDITAATSGASLGWRTPHQIRPKPNSSRNSVPSGVLMNLTNGRGRSLTKLPTSPNAANAARTPSSTTAPAPMEPPTTCPTFRILQGILLAPGRRGERPRERTLQLHVAERCPRELGDKIASVHVERSREFQNHGERRHSRCRARTLS